MTHFHYCMRVPRAKKNIGGRAAFLLFADWSFRVQKKVQKLNLIIIILNPLFCLVPKAGIEPALH